MCGRVCVPPRHYPVGKSLETEDDQPLRQPSTKINLSLRSPEGETYEGSLRDLIVISGPDSSRGSGSQSRGSKSPTDR